MTEVALAQLETAICRLLGRPEVLPPGEGLLLERAARTAEKLGCRAVASVPPASELGPAVARALRRGPVLVIDAANGTATGLARGEVPDEELLLAWQTGSAESLEPGIELMLAGSSGERRRRALRHLAAGGHGNAGAGEIPRHAVVLFERPGWRAEIGARIALGLGLEIAGIGLWIATWWVLAGAAFDQVGNAGWMGIWTLLVALRGLLAVYAGWQRTVAFQEIAETWRRRIFDRLLDGGQSAPGAGSLEGSLAEIEQVEMHVHQGALGLALFPAEIIAALLLIGRGAAPTAGIVAVLAAAAVLALLALRLFPATENWVRTRIEATRGALSRIDRHRMRWLFGDSPRERQREDEEIAGYAKTSKTVDDAALLVASLPYRLAVVGGVLALIPALLSNAAREEIAVALLGALLAAAALARLAEAAMALAMARSSLRRLRELLGTGAQTEITELGDPLELAPARPVQRLVFGSSSLRRGEKRRAAPEPSDPAGPPAPAAVRLDHLPPSLFGQEAAARRLCEPPPPAKEFLSANSLAFNLLAGRAWPPGQGDLEAAAAVCRDLELDDVAAGRRGGLAQIVGEGGRPLSDGETARVLLARSLLTEADFLVLRDPLAALDVPLRNAVVAKLAEVPAGVLVVLPEDRKAEASAQHRNAAEAAVGQHEERERRDGDAGQGSGEAARGAAG